MFNRFISIIVFVGITILCESMLSNSHLIILVLLLVFQFVYIDHNNKQEEKIDEMYRLLIELYRITYHYDNEELQELLRKIEEYIEV